METGKIILIIIGFLIIGYLLTNNIYISYDKIEMKNYKCVNNKIKETEKAFLSSPKTACSWLCLESKNRKNYYKEKKIIRCINNIPICDCKASIYSFYIKPLF